MGRPKKPTALKVLEGDFESHPERRNKAEPIPPTDLGAACPDCLTGLERDAWERVAPLLAKTRVLTDSDRELLTKFAVADREWRECVEDCRERGLVLVRIDAQGNEVRYRNPADTIATSRLNQIIKMLTELGMTPASRSKIVTDEVVDSLAEARERFLA